MKARLRLLALRVRGVLARAVSRTLMGLVPPRAQALVAGLPDSEENSLVTALALARRFRGRVVLVANDQALARQQLERVAAVLDAREAADAVVVVPKKGLATYREFLRSAVVAYTHGLYDSPRPAGRRLHVNLWHGSGPKWNANARQSQRIGADVLAANNEPWGREVARALAMPAGTRIVTGNARQDAMLAAARGPVPRGGLESLGINPDRPLVLWLPTFRASARAGRVGLREGEPLETGADPVLERLVTDAADAGVQLVLKTHRHDDDDYAARGVHALTTEDLHGAGLTLYQLLGLADAVVSDYSSVWVDFLATGRSVSLHCPDLQVYERDRGLNDPPLREVAGGLMLGSADEAAELVADVAAGRLFRAEALAGVREALGMSGAPRTPGTGAGSRADAMLDDLAAIARAWWGDDLGLKPPSSDA